MLIALALMTAQAPAAGPLDWLVGKWCTEPENGTQICESWTPMDDGVMRGEGTSSNDGRVTIGEAMRIHVTESGIFFHAEPKGQSPANFRAVRIDPKVQAVTFESRAYDYPQRIRYWTAQGLLMAEIAMADGSRAQRRAYSRRGSTIRPSLD